MVSLQEKLLLTDRGQKWLSQFAEKDRVPASRLVRGLTLVSHSKFARSVGRLIQETAASVSHPVALFAVRELRGLAHSEFCRALAESSTRSSIDATPTGSDLGSEAIVAALIRSLSNASGHLLNHPNVAMMRASQSKAIFLVDDIVGSGKRAKEYLEVIWENRSIRSWWSRKDIQFFVISFATTENGEKVLRKLKSSPTVVYNRVCPTLRSLPWSQQLKSEVSDLCQTYGERTSKRKFSFGYQGSAATLVFEHGCPNNVPAVLWAPPTPQYPWEALFPARTVLPPESSAFPLEIVRRDPLTLLVEAGQRRLAERIELPVSISRDTLLVLAYAEKGIRSSGALSFATGMDENSCRALIQACIGWGFLTLRNRLTPAGLAELNAARWAQSTSIQVASLGKDDYYPTTLREAT
jgi:hypothetical protein